MRIAGAHRHLTYCTNVHPGESWQAVRDDVLPQVARVKQRLGHPGPFGVGLRLGATAVRELLDTPDELERLRAWLGEQGLYVFTLNGFPYGDFHRTPVKQAVYEPDWRSPERLAYSNRLADVLAALLPQAQRYGSVSTVPLGFGPALDGPQAWRVACDQLLEHVAHLHRLHSQTGRRICLALEPEPGCALETSEDCVELFDHHLRTDASLRALAGKLGSSRDAARGVLDDHLGVCLDGCHAAVEFEEPDALLARLKDASIPIFKVQLSAGLRIEEMLPALRSEVERFAEDVYLHQVVQRADGELTRYLDLPDALASYRGTSGQEWRVHFHVPVFASQLGAFSSTQDFLRALCAALSVHSGCDHFEVETYTWGVLPKELLAPDLEGNLASELHWVLADSGLCTTEMP